MFNSLRDRLVECQDSKDVPKKTGLYFVFEKSAEGLNEPVYIGSATGKSGLYGRIHSQHLNPNYLETRISKSNTKDKFQLSCKKTKKDKNGKEVVCIDKSSLRKAIGRAHKIPPGDDTVSYIINNFNIFYITSENSDFEVKLNGMFKIFVDQFIGDIVDSDTSLIQQISKGMILSIENILIKEIKPRYNTQGKS